MKTGNGKIAIAIVAMFVVALSVVGVTYAYFTATVVGNTKNTGATVTAGELLGTWTGESVDKIQAWNVVPGWLSDGHSYYDPAYLYPDGKVSACTTLTGETTLFKDCAKDDDTVKKENGLADPITFTVNNTSTKGETIYYAITLETSALTGDESSELLADLVAHLYEVNEDENEDPVDELVKGNVPLAALNDHITFGPFDLASGSQKYKIVVEYPNKADQNTAQGTGFTVTADIVGIAEKEDGSWVAEDGSEVIAKPAA